MALKDINDRSFVLDAIRECDLLGRDAFLKVYGFGKAKSYELIYRGRTYDSKAILGVAHQYAKPTEGPLNSDDFTGGANTVQRRLEALGFVVSTDHTDLDLPKTSDWLVSGEVYTREDLKAIIQSDDATINTGVYRPRGTSSIWLFITENKTADRTQYKDGFADGLLHWQGQTQGRTDKMIVDHTRLGLELIVFFRTKKYEHAGAGFRCLGAFDYVSHVSGKPSSFVLVPVSMVATPLIESTRVYDGAEPANERPTMARAEAMARRGQGLFRYRVSLIERHCRVTGVDELCHLRASHIKPWTNSSDRERLDGHNGLLLAPHVDHLFDRGFITFRDDGGMLRSRHLNPQVLERWCITGPVDIRPFSSAQSRFLEFHRDMRFESATLKRRVSGT